MIVTWMITYPTYHMILITTVLPITTVVTTILTHLPALPQNQQPAKRTQVQLTIPAIPRGRGIPPPIITQTTTVTAAVVPMPVMPLVLVTAPVSLLYSNSNIKLLQRQRRLPW